ncbi:tryptophan-rich sensory protein [Salinicoccus albus]|uniref:tryptophan-rich sensory protein n=1 Tax=Salinicoccus albus TaxID=418756 RepID=UPI000366FEC9|nr:tryptophan-rich sensory protein [Salinicoccus albus]
MSVQKKWATGYLAAFIIMLLLNYWSGTNVGSVANDNQAIIQPAGFAFSIWGLIYVLLLIWIIKLFFSKTWEGSTAYQLKYWPIINFLLNGIWILVFTQQWMVVSVLVIIGLLYTLAKMYSAMTESGYHWFDRLPFSIYFGWVTIATVVNIFTLAVNNNIETILGLGELTWTIIILSAATLIGIVITFYFRDWLYPLVLIWPYFGIYTENDNAHMILDVTLIAASVVLLITALIAGVRKLRH